MKAFVFLGPSLDRTSASTVIDAHFLPPIKRGDIDALFISSAQPTHIGIIDGQFLHQPSISPKEILVAMDRGVQFYGSSSIGALRAVELSPYGMIGVGQIYELYQTGKVDADDEVAITYDPDSLRNISEPLVNIRLALSEAIAAGVLSRHSSDEIITAGKSIYFPHRTYPVILKKASVSLPQEEIEAFSTFLSERRPDAKKDDALELLKRIRTDMEGLDNEPDV
ncbi:TfuA-related McrA-glycine thioamidation protein [Mastigocladus laminosus UU774]|nr:TfuA-related McrA-glycine thioamidation protein [Mastigocladus laminosus UU774]